MTDESELISEMTVIPNNLHNWLNRNHIAKYVDFLMRVGDNIFV